MFFASHFKKRFTERSLDLIWQRVPDFGTYVVRTEGALSNRFIFNVIDGERVAVGF